MSTNHHWEDVTKNSDNSDDESKHTHTQSELTDSAYHLLYDEINSTAPNNFDEILRHSLAPIIAKLNGIESSAVSTNSRLENIDKELDIVKCKLENTNETVRELKHYSGLLENTRNDFQNTNELVHQLEKNFENFQNHLQQSIEPINKKLTTVESVFELYGRKLEITENLLEKTNAEQEFSNKTVTEEVLISKTDLQEIKSDVIKQLTKNDEKFVKLFSDYQKSMESKLSSDHSKINIKTHSFVVLMAIAILIAFSAYLMKVNDNKVNDLSTQMETKYEMLDNTMIEIYNMVTDLNQNTNRQDNAFENMENNLNALTNHYNQTSVSDLMKQIEVNSKLFDELIIEVKNSLVKHNKFSAYIMKVNDLSTQMETHNKTMTEFKNIFNDLSQNTDRQDIADKKISNMEINLNAIIIKVNDLSTQMEIKNEIITKTVNEIHNMINDLSENTNRQDIADKKIANIESNLIALIINVSDEKLNDFSTQMETKNEMLNKSVIEIYNMVTDLNQNSKIQDKAIERMEYNLNAVTNHYNQTSVGDLITEMEKKSKLLDELIIEVKNSIVKHKKFDKRVDLLENQVQTISKLTYNSLNENDNFGKRVEILENQVQSISKIKFTDSYSDEWKPDIRAFYVPDSVKSGANNFWVNCSLLGLTFEEVSRFILTLSKDNKIFYNISSDFSPNIFPVSGLEKSLLEISNDFYGSVRIKHPTVEAKGVYRCTLNTTRRGESKTAYKEYFVNVYENWTVIDYLLDWKCASILVIISIIVFFIGNNDFVESGSKLQLSMRIIIVISSLLSITILLVNVID